jgi:hypothetical protein
MPLFSLTISYSAHNPDTGALDWHVAFFHLEICPFSGIQESCAQVKQAGKIKWEKAFMFLNLLIPGVTCYFHSHSFDSQ